MDASLGGVHKQWGRPHQRGVGLQQGGRPSQTPTPLAVGAPPSNRGGSDRQRGVAAETGGTPIKQPPHPSIPNRDTPGRITACTLRLKRASYEHRQSVRAQPTHMVAGLHYCLPFWGEGNGEKRRRRLALLCVRRRRAHTRARRTRDHLTHRHHTLAPQRSSSQTLSASSRTRALSHLPRPPHLGRWPTTILTRGRPHRASQSRWKRLIRQYSNHLPKMQPEKRKRQKSQAAETKTLPSGQNQTNNRPRNMVE